MLKHEFHFTEEIFILVTFIDDVRRNDRQSCDARLQPEVIKVHDKKKQNQRSQKRHAARIPIAAGGCFFVSVLHRSCFSVLEKKYKTIYNVKNQSEEEYNLHCSDDKIGAHEMSPFVERHAAIVEKNHRIDGAVNDEEGDEKKSGE